MEKSVLNWMFDNLLHIWNKTNFWNAKMKPYIYGSVNWIHVINLLETSKKLEEVKAELKEISASWKKILFVSTKLQSQDAFRKIAEETGHFYVNEKWVPGLLTNFKTIKRRIATYLQLLKDSENGVFEVLTKKEKATRLLELDKLNKAYAWLKEMKRLPDAIFVSDWVYEKQALKEARVLKIKSFAILNTNWDIDAVDNFLCANTNSVKSFDYIASEIRSVLWVSAENKKWTVKKIEDKKVSWEKPKTTRKPRVKKEEKVEETNS